MMGLPERRFVETAGLDHFPLAGERLPGPVRRIRDANQPSDARVVGALWAHFGMTTWNAVGKRLRLLIAD